MFYDIFTLITLVSFGSLELVVFSFISSLFSYVNYNSRNYENEKLKHLVYKVFSDSIKDRGLLMRFSNFGESVVEGDKGRGHLESHSEEFLYRLRNVEDWLWVFS